MNGVGFFSWTVMMVCVYLTIMMSYEREQYFKCYRYCAMVYTVIRKCVIFSHG